MQADVSSPRWWNAFIAGAAVFAVISVLGFWLYISIPVAHVALSTDRYCKLEFHQWYSGKCILSYYDHDACVGIVKLNNDLFNDPLAFFPGPDGNTVICLSWPDTFDAAFTVDLSRSYSKGVVIPDRLRLSGQEAVDFSNFEVRACTPKEVAFVAHYIETAEFHTFSNCVRWGAKTGTRENLSRFLIWATSPNVWSDPVLKDAKPLILPEDLGDAR